jgi:hypothetical protein
MIYRRGDSFVQLIQLLKRTTLWHLVPNVLVPLLSFDWGYCALVLLMHAKRKKKMSLPLFALKPRH